MWVDSDEENLYPYNTKKHLLTDAVPGSCITYIRVDALTGDKAGADFSRRWGKNHLMVLILSNDQKLQAQLKGPMIRDRDRPYTAVSTKVVPQKRTRQCRLVLWVKSVRR